MREIGITPVMLYSHVGAESPVLFHFKEMIRQQQTGSQTLPGHWREWLRSSNDLPGSTGEFCKA